jgi:hypothetical protein
MRLFTVMPLRPDQARRGPVLLVEWHSGDSTSTRGHLRALVEVWTGAAEQRGRRNHRTPATTRHSQRRRGGGPAAPELGRPHLGAGPTYKIR